MQAWGLRENSLIKSWEDVGRGLLHRVCLLSAAIVLPLSLIVMLSVEMDAAVLQSTTYSLSAWPLDTAVICQTQVGLQFFHGNTQTLGRIDRWW